MHRLRGADATESVWNTARSGGAMIAATTASSTDETDVRTVWRMLPDTGTGTTAISFLAEAAL